MTFAECFNQLLKENGVSKQELARQLGISGTAVYQKFRTNQFTSSDIKTILRLCEASFFVESKGNYITIDKF